MISSPEAKAPTGTELLDRGNRGLPPDVSNCCDDVLDDIWVPPTVCPPEFSGSGLPRHQRVPIAVAVSGAESCELFAPLADHMIAVEPNAELATIWNAARPGKGASRRIGQLPICFDADRETAIARAHEQFRWFGGGWKVNAELPSTAGFAAATQFIRADDIAEHISCGPDVDMHVAAARPFAEAGFTDLALVQIGGAPQHQQPFLDYTRDKLLPALRAEFTATQP